MVDQLEPGATLPQSRIRD